MAVLSIFTERRNRDCDGFTRRDFLRVGALGAGTLSLSSLLAARAHAAAAGEEVKDTSVVWLWLGGGPTHVETFDPKMTAPREYRSVTGEVRTAIPGVSLGGTYPKMARVADKMVFVRSFAHRNSGHGGGTHWVMTGYDNRNIDNGGLPSRPSMSPVVSAARFRRSRPSRSRRRSVSRSRATASVILRRASPRGSNGAQAGPRNVGPSDWILPRRT